MSNLEGQTGELRFTIEVKRKETGKVEYYEMVGTPIYEVVGSPMNEKVREDDGCDALDGSA